MKARGAFVVDMAWEESKLKQATILSGKGAVCRLKTSGPVTVMHKNNAVELKRLCSLLVLGWVVAFCWVWM